MTKEFFGSIVTKAAGEGEDSEWELVFEARPTTEDVDSYGEVTDPDAFMEAAGDYMKQNPVMMFNHRSEFTIGKVLKIWRDKTGPLIKGGIAKTTIGKDVAALIRAGVVSKMSFMFGGAVYEDDEENRVRLLKKFKLYEIGPVSIPANMGAVITAAKDLNIELSELKEPEAHFKGAKKMAELETKTVDEMEKIVGGFKDQVADLTKDFKGFEATQDRLAKTIKQVQEKLQQSQGNQITPGEFEEFVDRVAGDIKTLRADIDRHQRARKIADSRESIFGWKAFEPTITPVVFNDHGQPLSDVQQRAWHLFQSPVKYEGETGRLLKETRDLYDAVLFTHSAMRKTTAGNYNITRLKSWGILTSMVEYWDPKLAEAMKAMSSTGSAVGDEWVPTESSAELYSRYLLKANVENYIPHWDMPSNPATWPIRTTRPTMYRASERTVDNPSQLTKSNMATAKATFTAETFAVAVAVSPEFVEDSIIAVVPALRESIADAMAASYESLLINGDTTATHRDTQASYTSASPESYEKGFRFLAIDASQTFDTQSTNAGVGDATAAFAAKDVRYLRALLPGHYGANAADLVYVTSLKPYIYMLSMTELSQPGVYGTPATWVNGQLPGLDGSPLVISGELDETLHTDGIWSAADTTNTHKAVICFNKNGFKVGQKRGINVSMAFDVLTQQWAFVGTMRKSFQAMDSQIAVSYAYNIE